MAQGVRFARFVIWFPSVGGSRFRYENGSSHDMTP